MFRNTIFWVHLACGVVASLVILLMSVTGVLLTYERQVIAWADRGYHREATANESRQSLQALIDAARISAPDVRPGGITVAADRSAPVVVSLGRGRDVSINPYTAEVLGEGAQEIRAFFRATTGWHRWFNSGNENRTTYRAITGACNLAFLFLVVSGIYLWLPRMYKWPMFRVRLVFNQHNATSKARDYNWHHAFGIWSALPLAVVVATAVVMSYPWANDLVYRIAGEEPPSFGGSGPGGQGPGGPGGPPGGRGEAGGPAGSGAPAGMSRGGLPAGSGAMPAAGAEPTLSLDELFDRAAGQIDDWQTIALRLPIVAGAPTGITIDQGNGGQPQKRHQLNLDPVTGAVASWEPFTEQSPGRRLRIWIRFLHTGEALGITGQTIAGVVSFTSVLMVWTGLALAWRRLIQPLFR